MMIEDCEIIHLFVVFKKAEESKAAAFASFCFRLPPGLLLLDTEGEDEGGGESHSLVPPR